MDADEDDDAEGDILVIELDDEDAAVNDGSPTLTEDDSVEEPMAVETPEAEKTNVSGVEDDNDMGLKIAEVDVYMCLKCENHVPDLDYAFKHLQLEHPAQIGLMQLGSQLFLPAPIGIPVNVTPQSGPLGIPVNIALFPQQFRLQQFPQVQQGLDIAALSQALNIGMSQSQQLLMAGQNQVPMFVPANLAFMPQMQAIAGLGQAPVAHQQQSTAPPQISANLAVAQQTGQQQVIAAQQAVARLVSQPLILKPWEVSSHIRLQHPGEKVVYNRV
nr:hypothetical protein BaRGS_019656 [Batillaria attramentaria]